MPSRVDCTPAGADASAGRVREEESSAPSALLTSLGCAELLHSRQCGWAWASIRLPVLPWPRPHASGRWSHGAFRTPETRTPGARVIFAGCVGRSYAGLSARTRDPRVGDARQCDAAAMNEPRRHRGRRPGGESPVVPGATGNAAIMHGIAVAAVPAGGIDGTICTAALRQGPVGSLVVAAP